MISQSVAILLCVAVLCRADPPSWQQCVEDIAIYHRPVSTKEFTFVEPNPCGFHTYNASEIESVAFAGGGALTFAGDSTIVRGFMYVMNNVMMVPMPMARVLSLPSSIHQNGKGGSLHFYRTLYMSQTGRELCEFLDDDALFAKADRVVLYFCLGNYDMNWKYHKKNPMPGLDGPTQSFDGAKRYWVKYVNESMNALNVCIKSRNAKSPGKLTIIYREQWYPWCPAARYSNPKRRFRDCKGTLLMVVPWYRKVLQPLLRQMNIPIIPIDHMFAKQYKYCSMGDGVHLDGACKPHELQMLYNVIALMRARGVVHGTTEKLIDTRTLVDAIPNSTGVPVAVAPTPTTPLPTQVDPVPSPVSVATAQVTNISAAPTRNPTITGQPAGVRTSTWSAFWNDNKPVIIGCFGFLVVSVVWAIDRG